MKNNKSENQLLVREVFSKFLDSKSHRKTPERFSILKEIYDSNDHFPQWFDKKVGYKFSKFYCYLIS